MAKEYPLLCQTDMVRAILYGIPVYKDTTRRLSNVWAKRKPGERLWVRETFFDTRINLRRMAPLFQDAPDFLYRADDADIGCHKWRPSIFMPREACRIILEITELFQEPLQAMNKAEAKREGISSDNDKGNELVQFAELWDKINPKKTWRNNPRVWVVRFRRVS